MKAELIDSMGSDLTVVNAARVSFDKESEWEIYEAPAVCPREDGSCCGLGYGECPDDYYEEVLSEKDQKLISYLAKHNHWTPFSHVQITMRETVPIFVARQRFKHVVGFSYNEVSRRYVDDKPNFYVPTEWRERSENKKQGSSNEIVKWPFLFASLYDWDISKLEDWHEASLHVYNALLTNGVAPEQARMVLPQSMYTSYYVTGSLAAWARAYTLRSEEHAQKEIRDLADQWNTVINSIPELKHSWTALTK